MAFWECVLTLLEKNLGGKDRGPASNQVSLERRKK